LFKNEVCFIRSFAEYFLILIRPTLTVSSVRSADSIVSSHECARMAVAQSCAEIHRVLQSIFLIFISRAIISYSGDAGGLPGIFCWRETKAELQACPTDGHSGWGLGARECLFPAT
jgi:hypothetical protein